MTDPEDKKPKGVPGALSRARDSVERMGEAETAHNAAEEVAATDPDEAPLADPEAAPKPAYHKQAETAPHRSAAEVARALADEPEELSLYTGNPAPGPAAPPQAEAPEAAMRLGDTSSPVDLPEPAVPLPHPLRWTTVTIAVATLLLAVLNAQTIRSWAYQLEPTPANARIVAIAEGWFDATASVGLDRPFAALHGWWNGIKDSRFGNDSAAGEGEGAPPPPGNQAAP